jgi:hypothetical protein
VAVVAELMLGEPQVTLGPEKHRILPPERPTP